MQGKIEGKRGRGRPATKWFDNIKTMKTRNVFQLNSTKKLKIELNGDGMFKASPGVERLEGQLQQQQAWFKDIVSAHPLLGQHIILMRL